MPSDALEFFNIKAPLAVPVVKRKSPFSSFEIVSPLPKMISFPETVKSPLSVVLADVIAITLSEAFEIVSLFPKLISFPETVKSPLNAVVGACISKVTSALISICPSVEELIARSVSRNDIALSPVRVPIVLAVIPVKLDPSPANAVAVSVPVFGL